MNSSRVHKLFRHHEYCNYLVCCLYFSRHKKIILKRERKTKKKINYVGSARLKKIKKSGKQQILIRKSVVGLPFFQFTLKWVLFFNVLWQMKKPLMSVFCQFGCLFSQYQYLRSVFLPMGYTYAIPLKNTPRVYTRGSAYPKVHQTTGLWAAIGR